ncbi:MAG: nitrite/sulfite reductase [Pseudomonadales bacterium]|nr:nitrite/sulfite reductase [Pseudomonadales bacterium]
MYLYNDLDKKLIGERVDQYREQTTRFLDGKLEAQHFLPLRLQNGLYVQRHAPMMRIAIPYGLLSSKQLRMLAHICRHYDKGYAHFTTRQNIQINWPQLSEVPDILADLAKVEMHAVQTSGNCIRNVTSDQFAGVATDEIVDPRPYCEIIRQWSTFHPEFAFLPRKFKIAVSGSIEDRAAIRFHDIGLKLKKANDGAVNFEVYVGGGLGRTPVIGECIAENISATDILTYLEAILRVYNLHGRRDNKYKARIKITVQALGIEEFRRRVDEQWQYIRQTSPSLPEAEIIRVANFFRPPAYLQKDELACNTLLQNQCRESRAFSHWLTHNITPHRVPGYAAVTLSMKPTGLPPGDVTEQQLDAIADIADDYSFGEARVSHQQNLILADVEKERLFSLWQKLDELNLATPNINTLNDSICCPGGDFCSLANARSIPVAEAIQRKFDDLDYLYDLGNISLNISGCMNACGHHHIGNIGILGVDKKGKEFFQVSLGGDAGYNGSIAEILGPSFPEEDIPDVIEKILQVYLEKRQENESFINTLLRIGKDSFKERVYA